MHFGLYIFLHLLLPSPSTTRSKCRSLRITTHSNTKPKGQHPKKKWKIRDIQWDPGKGAIGTSGPMWGPTPRIKKIVNKRLLVSYTRAAVVNSVQEASHEIAEQINQGNFIHNHSIHHVFWKNAAHVILLWNPQPALHIQSFHSLPFSLPKKWWKRTQQIL